MLSHSIEVDEEVMLVARPRGSRAGRGRTDSSSRRATLALRKPVSTSPKQKKKNLVSTRSIERRCERCHALEAENCRLETELARVRETCEKQQLEIERLTDTVKCGKGAAVVAGLPFDAAM